MMRRYTYNNIVKAARLLSLVVLMAFGAGLKGWGQYSIKSQEGKKNPQVNIPTLVDTVYVKNGESRTLKVANFSYYWYMRWYRKNTIESPITTNTSFLTSSNSGLYRTSQNDSYFWCYILPGSNKTANQIDYLNSNIEVDSVFCDLSFYVDGLILSSTIEFIEPTISKRYKFYIKNADEMRNRLNNLEGKALETFYITVPNGATGVNLQMNMTPENYYWGNDSQGNSFIYFIDDGLQGTSTPERLITINNAINVETTVKVYAATNGDNGFPVLGPLLAKFILTPQENSGFETEAAIENDEDRNPSKYSDKYAQVGVIDFDYESADSANDGVILCTNLSAENNWMSKSPIDPSLTTYGFATPLLPWINGPGFMPEDTYGLYRSANVPGISNAYEGKTNLGFDRPTSWGMEYDLTNVFTEWYKTYGWYYTKVNGLEKKELYDRTYYNTEGDSCGYFYYVNASQEAGRVVTIPIDGTICANTELTITAWVADITDGANTVPNVSLMLRGVNTDNSKTAILHRFSSGDMLRADGINGLDRAIWKQLCYKVTISQQLLNEYEDFFVDFYNNTPNSNGADYAIDDIRIYKSLPAISVRRENACDASTLIVSTDYETILRNMGWEEEQIVASEEHFDYDNLQLRKYRYGLMGDNHQYKNSVVGNVYFAFLTEDKLNWVIVNKNAVDVSDVAARAIRIPVSTVQGTDGGYEFYTTDREQAMLNEKIMNLRAVNDYNTDISLWQIKYSSEGHETISTEGIGTPGQPDFNEAKYQEAIETLYNRLNIPRLRCPWYNEAEGNNGRLYLAVVDVNDTDLKYQGEQYKKEDGTYATANGNYHVLSFSAADVAGFGGTTGVTPPGQSGVDPDSDCALVSPFTVYPATTITVTTETEASTALCLGALRKIKPILNAYDKETMEPIENFSNYVFDWYLGTLDEYNKQLIGDQSIKYVLNAYRSATKNYKEITLENINDWGSGTTDQKNGLKNLIESGILRTGIPGGETFSTIINSEEIVAIPYVWIENNNYDYCTEVTKVTFDVSDSEIPDYIVGISGVKYLSDDPVPLRLGRRHLDNKQSLTIPIRKTLKMAEGVDHFASDAKNKNVYLKQNDADPIPVGTVAADFTIQCPSEGTDVVADMTITWGEQALENMKEGQSYYILVPFVQVDMNGNVLESECDGLASFPVKVVPEYLTWQGTTGEDVWYNDERSWKQSNEKELYMGSQSETQDVNGDDDVKVFTYSPLYFTKITLPEGQELSLLDPTYVGVNDKTIGNLDDGYTIQYDMAVDTVKPVAPETEGSIEVVPYYINKVSEIYFKPEATLMNQHYLDYQKAWVEFESIPETPYWMSSPLKSIYAGDMYAPSSNGRQETEAFKDITYSGTVNSRWNPAFYQKAWDKAIRYAASDEDNDGIPADDEIANVNAVKSNWSIEYNDVTVPYSLGKGFYSKVEKESEGNVLVRLPKADTEYKYETKTRALTDTGKLPDDYGRLADGSEIIIDLSKEDTETTQEEVDGDGKHFLVGNPYMTYLNMKAFFDNNGNLNRKFWTLDRNAGSIVVGTPDIYDWSNDVDGYHDHTVESTQSYVAPMTAFFVELSDKAGNDKTIEFTTAMMAAKPTITDNVYTKSYSASNPILTLTAERGETRSVARLLTSDKGHDEYEASEDAVLLLDSELDAPMVYTVAGDVAAQFNTLRSIKNVPLGIYNKKGDEVTLTISGLSRLVEPLYLYDAWTGKSKELTGDSYQLTVEGESLGRYYLRNEALASELESTISIYSFQPGEIVAASSGAALRQVRVYSVNGELVTQRSAVGQTACRLSVPRGAIYMIYAEDTKGNSQSVKLRVR